ncbi:hypothetical protein JTE90_008133 [Oedothorax gibbosus]|uniref:Uncharacterized protein n=1 Tax=Oedothorax gibbosus TaxID=931172 RepID=A0AAV6TY45_9ARAC|nr:hypothetical protein JTE90_008133 [Oedothorax gibbosus]
MSRRSMQETGGSGATNHALSLPGSLFPVIWIPVIVGFPVLPLIFPPTVPVAVPSTDAPSCSTVPVVPKAVITNRISHSSVETPDAASSVESVPAAISEALICSAHLPVKVPDALRSKSAMSFFKRTLISRMAS